MKLTPEQLEQRKNKSYLVSAECRRKRKAAYKAIHGVNPPTSERRKEQMRIYARAKRAKAAELRPPKVPKPPKPTKQHITKIIKVKPVKIKAMPIPKKPKKKPKVFKTRNSSEGKIKIRIDHKTEVEIYPHQDPDEVRARYLNRRI